MTILLESATGITKCDDYYKVRQYRQYSVKNQLPSEKEENLWRILGKSRKELFPASVSSCRVPQKFYTAAKT